MRAGRGLRTQIRGTSRRARGAIEHRPPLLHRPTVLAVSAGLLAVAIGWPVMLGVIIAAFVGVVRGPRYALQALVVMMCIKYLNEHLYRFPPLTSTLAWLLLFLAALRVYPAFTARAVPVLVPLGLFILIAGMLAPMASNNLTISIMKLVSLTAGAGGVVIAAMSLRAADARYLRSWLPSFAFAFVLVSLLTIPFRGISYALMPGQFQGVFTHPQNFGTFLAPLVTLLAARLLFGQDPIRPLPLALLGLAGIMLVATATRTAMLAVALGIACALALGGLHQRDRRREAGQGAVLIIGGAALVAIVLAASGQAREFASGVLFKYDQGQPQSIQNIDDAFYASRGKAVEAQWRNFLAQPVTGNGFGVYAGRATNAETFLGLPITAPVEKGFLPTAVLEEVGIVGGMAFLLLIFAMVRTVFRTGDQPWTAVLFTCIFVNLGEAVFFSVGGIGLVFWVWMALAMRGEGPLSARDTSLATGAERRPGLRFARRSPEPERDPEPEPGAEVDLDDFGNEADAEIDGVASEPAAGMDFDAQAEAAAPGSQEGGRGDGTVAPAATGAPETGPPDAGETAGPMRRLRIDFDVTGGFSWPPESSASSVEEPKP